jgi:hypothetical protein
LIGDLGAYALGGFSYLLVDVLYFIGFASSLMGFSTYFSGTIAFMEGIYDLGSSFFVISLSKGLYPPLFELFSTFGLDYTTSIGFEIAYST